MKERPSPGAIYWAKVLRGGGNSSVRFNLSCTMYLLIALLAFIVALLAYKHFTKRVAPRSKLGPLSTTVDDDVPSEPLNKRIVVITGGTGYFGSACVQHFIEHSEYDEIRVVDVAKGRLIDHPRINFIQTNLLELENCLAVVDGAEVVVHLAGIVDLRPSKYIHDLLWAINVQGTWNMLEASIRRGVRGFVFTSSDSTLCCAKPGISAATEQELLKYWETTQPHSSYGASKKAAAQLALSVNGYGRLQTTVLMPGLILGPREPRLLAGVQDPNFIHLHSPENAGLLNVVWTQSLARAQLAAATKIVQPNNSKVAGHIFMIYDFVKNVVEVEIALRDTLGLPRVKALNAKRHLIYIASYIVNWITNDKLNSGFLQASYASDQLMLFAATFGSHEEATNSLGWKPSTIEDLMKDIEEHHNPKKK